ncbi:MAG: hypothetical protein ABIS10_01405 [Novosphingobium sp.]
MEFTPITPPEASHSAETDAQHIVTPGTFPLAATAHIAGQLLNRHSPHEIAEAVEVLLDVLNLMGGDPDAEDATDAEDDFSISPQALDFTTGAGCEVADADQASWEEFHTRGNRKAYPPGLTFNEDDEEDDAREEDDGDSAVDDRPCDDINMDLEEESDAEQMHDDVPMLPVFSLDHNPFSDQRVSLGFSNLMTSFVTGKDIRSADTGNMHRGIDQGRKPGVPV